MVSTDIATVTGVSKLANSATITNRIEFIDNLFMFSPRMRSPRMGAHAAEAYALSVTAPSDVDKEIIQNKW
jgi:hypothetical protein